MLDQNNDNYSIIPHTSQPRMFLLREEAGWTLPHHSGARPEEINAAMHEQLGLTTTILSCIYECYKDEEGEEQHRVYTLENHSPGVLPPTNGRFIDRAELANLPLIVPDHRSVLEAWFAEVDGSEFHEQQPSWMRPGWFASATIWIAEQIGQLGYTLAAPIEQIVSKPWAAVLLVN